VPAGAQHRVAVGVERALEVGRAVGLDPADDARLVGVGVDLASGGRPEGMLLAEALPAESQDRVGVQPIEGAQADQLVVALAADRPGVRAAVEGALEPRSVQLDRDLGRLARALEAALLARRQDVGPGRDEFVEEGRQFRSGLDLDALPTPNLWDGGPGLGFLEVRGDRLQPAGDRVEPLGERRVVAREQEEQAVADVIEGERALLPEARTSASKIDLRTLCSSRSRSKAASLDSAAGSSASTAARWARSASSSPRTASRPPSPSRSSSWCRPSAVPRTGLSRTSRTKRVSTRSYSASSSRPGSAAGAGRDRVVVMGRSITDWEPPVRRAAGTAPWSGVMARRIRSGQTVVAAGRRLVSASAARVASMAVSISAEDTP
jgi:hypothetical protein